MKIRFLQLFSILSLILFNFNSFAQTGRESIDFNFDWKFALGHASDVSKDFNFTTSHFSYLAKTGYGDGPAAEKFDDRAWRTIQIPHDWCIALPLDSRASNSHGNQAIGRNFPENSVGWYRKQFFIPKSDTSKRIKIEFEGVYRDAKVFINGFYVGGEESGYLGFSFDITEYLNFGGNNVLAIRVDATLEEGWYYEGAGIYRNVKLVKTNKVHFYDKMPMQIQTNIVKKSEHELQTTIVCGFTVINESINEANTTYKSYVYNSENQIIDSSVVQQYVLIPQVNKLALFSSKFELTIKKPILWSLETPYLYTVKTIVFVDGKEVDSQIVSFGVRTVSIDKDKGFFLNGKSVKIKGVCVHQDHAGVGVAIPYELQKWRIHQLKAIGVNAIRTSHNPPSPDLLNICDELGMLVLDEVRLMGINEYHLNLVSRHIMRDRNHPSVFMWSLGNEEWTIEGNEKGAKITEYMQKHAKTLDNTRPFTVASSGGWDTGIGMKSDVMGYNYLSHGNVDLHHKKFPWQPSIGTEESNTVRTRGIYKTNDSLCWLAPKNLYDGGMEGGWKFYYEREFLAGLFYWTGFDYHGEPTPYGWPAVVSQFGILDLCGFPKDNASYLTSWWTNKPEIQIETNWNRIPGEKIDLNIYSNAKQIELILNGKNLGRKSMEKNSHITWPVTFEPGTLIANAYGSYVSGNSDTTKILFSKKITTTGKPVDIQIIPHKKVLQADGQDVSICTVQIVDDKGIVVPDANVNITFELQGNGKIIGIGNGNPSSHEKEIFEDKIQTFAIENLQEKPIEDLANPSPNYNDWRPAFSAEPKDWQERKDTLLIIYGTFTIEELTDQMNVTLFSKSILDKQSIYINGKIIRENIPNQDTNQAFVLDHNILLKGKNDIYLTGIKLKRPNQWDFPNRDPGLIQIVTPVEKWNRTTFNGLAQIIVQSTKNKGIMVLQANAPELQKTEIKIQTQ